MKTIVLGAAVAGLAGVVSAGALSGTPCPQVDLGYAVHEAIFNETEGVCTFKNIRYGDPPVGELRFQPSLPVSTTNRTVSDGSVGFKCPQAYPDWALKDAAAEASVSTEEMLQSILNDPLVNDDCLFLDITVSQDVCEMAGSENGEVPVMVWLHGGGYVFGHKDEEQHDPSGIIVRSRTGDSKGVLVVAVNYRLGLFGWLNGLGDVSILANLGLQNQILALNWIQKYIGKFGSDTNKVTVVGQSAGAGSIIHHVTADGGREAAPFQRAIVQSPGWESVDIEDVWNNTLAVASTVSGKHIARGADLAALDFETLNQVNGALVFGSTNGSFTFSPTVDGGYVPTHPDNLLLEGRFNPDVDLMIGHNANEAGLFVSLDVDTEEGLLSSLSHFFENFRQESVDYILTELYPPPSESDGAYATNYERATHIVSEASFVCHTRALATAFGNQTWNYRFEVPPAVHAQDVPWTFFHGNGSDVVYEELAQAMQLYFTSFAMTSDPNNEPSLPQWPEYGDEARIATFGIDGVGDDVDDAKNKRCDFWQRGAYRK